MANGNDGENRPKMTFLQKTIGELTLQDLLDLGVLDETSKGHGNPAGKGSGPRPKDVIVARLVIEVPKGVGDQLRLNRKEADKDSPEKGS